MNSLDPEAVQVAKAFIGGMPISARFWRQIIDTCDKLALRSGVSSATKCSITTPPEPSSRTTGQCASDPGRIGPCGSGRVVGFVRGAPGGRGGGRESSARRARDSPFKYLERRFLFQFDPLPVLVTYKLIGPLL